MVMSRKAWFMLSIWPVTWIVLPGERFVEIGRRLIDIGRNAAEIAALGAGIDLVHRLDVGLLALPGTESRVKVATLPSSPGTGCVAGGAVRVVTGVLPRSFSELSWYCGVCTAM